MNFNFKFENVTVEKKLGAFIFAILLCIIFVSIAVTIYAFKLAEDKNLYDTQTKAELFAATLSEEMKETVSAVKFISTLATEEDLKNVVTPEKITILLNKVIDSDNKISGAFIMLDNKEVISDDSEEMQEEQNIVKETFVNTTNKLVYKIGDVRYEATLDRLNNLEYKKNYMKVLTTKAPQMMLPYETDYGNAKITTCTYTLPILKDGVVDGVFGIDINVEELNKEFAVNKYHTEETFLILDNEGQVITSNDEKFLNRNISDIFDGSANKQVLEFINSSLKSGVSKIHQHKIAGLLYDDVYITSPIMIDNEHAWNLLVISKVEKIIISSISVILFAVILNLVAFALFVLFLWSCVGKTMNKQMNKMLKEVETRLNEMQKLSKNIDFEKLEKLNNVEVNKEELSKEIEEDKLEVKSENSVNEKNEIDDLEDESLITDMVEADEKLDKLLEKTDLEKYDSVTSSSENQEEQIEEIDEDSETLGEIVQETTEDTESSNEEDINKKEEKEENIDLDNPLEDENGNKLSAIDQLSTQDSYENQLEADLDEIFANKDGTIEDDTLLKQAEEKMLAAMGDKKEDIKIKVEDEEEKVGEELKIEEKSQEDVVQKEVIEEQPKVEEKKEETVKEPEVIEETKKEEIKEEISNTKAFEEPVEVEKPQRKGGKLSSKDMDDLLRELEKKRRAENEALGIEEEITNDFSNETTLDMNSIKDMVDKISAD